MPRPKNTQFAVAVHLLTLLSMVPDHLQTSTALGESVGTNPVHVRRILGLLRVAGLVTSRPGVRGGWQVTPAPATLTLDQVWRAVQKDDQVLGLHAAKPNCVAGQLIQHALGTLDRRAAAAIERELSRITLVDLTAGTIERHTARTG